MEDNNLQSNESRIFEILNSYNEKTNRMVSKTLLNESIINRSKYLEQQHKKHLNNIKDFVNSFDGCSVNYTIMGEWNIIQREIREYLFNINIQYGGNCPKIKEFIQREKLHLNSIKSKIGPDAIEYQMICSLVVESVILDIESSMILVNVFERSKYSEVNNIVHRRMLKDCLNALENVATLNMEYQYKYERFTPFYTSIVEKGEKLGLVKSGNGSSGDGCLSVMMLVIVNILLCSYLLL